jgi:hypothetical protein
VHQFRTRALNFLPFYLIMSDSIHHEKVDIPLSTPSTTSTEADTPPVDEISIKREASQTENPQTPENDSEQGSNRVRGVHGFKVSLSSITNVSSSADETNQSGSSFAPPCMSGHSSMVRSNVSLPGWCVLMIYRRTRHDYRGRHPGCGLRIPRSC